MITHNLDGIGIGICFCLALISALKQPACDHLGLDLRRAFENVENARVA